MSHLTGRTAVVTGAARGQGRSHALALAAAGADVVAIDLCGQIDHVPYKMSEPEDLSETARLAEDLPGTLTPVIADVRDGAAMEKAVAGLSRIDIVVANAGIWTKHGPFWEFDPASWQNVLDVNLTGEWNTVRVCVPTMIEAGNGGSVVLIGSSSGLKSRRNMAPYTVTKRAIVALAEVMAIELGPFGIRVNSVHPGNVDTPMIRNEALAALFVPHIAEPTEEDVRRVAAERGVLGVPWVPPETISAAVMWLVSDAAKHVTGVALPVDTGSVLN